MTRPITLSIPLQTIENPAYLIPPGTYTLGLHRWSKTGKLVPILQNVPVAGSGPATLREYGHLPGTSPSSEGAWGCRTGILIHNGTRPEHSHGCLLAPQSVIDSLVVLIQNTPKDEKVLLKISSEK